MGEMALLLAAVQQEDRKSAHELLVLVYTELRRLAAEAMRRILIDNARRKQCHQHGGDRDLVDWEIVALPSPMPNEELVAMNEALDRLAVVDPRAAELVKLQF